MSEFNVPDGYAKTDIPLMNSEMRRKKDVLICAIIRNGETLIPKGNDVLKSKDRIFVLTESRFDINSLDDIFS